MNQVTALSTTDRDRALMRLALAEAERSRGWVEPNPMVGAVVSRDGELIAIGRHERFGGPHAEVHALTAAGTAARGSTLHVTLEPCRHYGKTPPCTEAILSSGIARVVAATADPFPEVAGRGFERLRSAGIEVTVGVEEAAARRLIAPFVKRVETGKPYVIAKWAMTLDGRIATVAGESRWISGPESRSRVHETRGVVDAILVGIGTVIADDPMLDARPPGPRTAARVVLDARARIPLDSRLVRTARDIPTWLAVGPDATGDAISTREVAGCRILRLPGDVHGRPLLDPLLRSLGELGVTNLLIEGGAGVLGAFFDANEVDEVDVFVAPKIFGGGTAPGPVAGIGIESPRLARRLEDRVVTLLGDDVRIQGRTVRAAVGPRPT
ncbi:MAG: bifunctional diaminohydroxyphosphoribosylaminopyrimidine deaminase/5-amino-6-(5-phosphoribosylamino)uracil reductase RibD [Isosphaeraceae bacterium]|nr:bifunctional diaminohydroxyphosphoribosylaminopyrimidine deaminase/5-amino-6-(5-phosphoribosylamino)uracil reductase RibD [Isosphaeraceae bacterium]